MLNLYSPPHRSYERVAADDEALAHEHHAEQHRHLVLVVALSLFYQDFTAPFFPLTEI
jgi:hypothetical protein